MPRLVLQTRQKYVRRHNQCQGSLRQYFLSTGTDPRSWRCLFPTSASSKTSSRASKHRGASFRSMYIEDKREAQKEKERRLPTLHEDCSAERKIKICNRLVDGSDNISSRPCVSLTHESPQGVLADYTSRRKREYSRCCQGQLVLLQVLGSPSIGRYDGHAKGQCEE